VFRIGKRVEQPWAIFIDHTCLQGYESGVVVEWQGMAGKKEKKKEARERCGRSEYFN